MNSSPSIYDFFTLNNSNCSNLLSYFDDILVENNHFVYKYSSYNYCNNVCCRNLKKRIALYPRLAINNSLKTYYQYIRGYVTTFNTLRHNFPIFGTYNVIILTELWLTSDVIYSDLVPLHFLSLYLTKKSTLVL